MIHVDNLTKTYGQTRAVDGITFTVQPGTVTGFLGPNGAGKSTAMRVILGLDAPTSGWATVNGRPISKHGSPLREVGALLDAKAVHPKRTAYAHLRSLAMTNGIAESRVGDVLSTVGLESVANRPVGQFSLGMHQRLGIAGALLGDPQTIMLDEPVNGLDPEGIVWIRNTLRALAGDGRTVFVSSHLMSEMAMTADHFVIVGRGRLIADVSADELTAMGSGRGVRVRTPDVPALLEGVTRARATVTDAGDGVFVVAGLEADAVGQLAHDRGCVLHELTPLNATLETTFMELTGDATEYAGNPNQGS